MSQYEINLNADEFVPAEYTEFGTEISDQYPQIVDQLLSGELTGHPIEIYDPEIPKDVPTFKELVEKFQDNPDLLSAILYLYKYIVTPVVIDNFGTDDASRQKWEEKLALSYGDSEEEINKGKFALTIVNQNKFRYNSLTNVFYGLQILAIFDDEQWQSSEYFSRLRPEVASSDEYRALTFDQKKEVMDETTQLVYDLLKDIYKAK